VFFSEHSVDRGSTVDYPSDSLDSCRDIWPQIPYARTHTHTQTNAASDFIFCLM